MLSIIVTACALVAVTVAVHAIGLGLLLKFLMASQAQPPTRFWSVIWLLICVTWWLILIHATEITVWALFYVWRGCLADAGAAFYFSGVTYTTVGYGDVVLRDSWRILGPFEGLTGILMCGLSAGVFFAVINRLL